jgi:AP-3 complex subunit delta-1
MATPDLSRDLLQDVTNLLSSSRPLVRKKAVIALYRLLRRLPEALPTAFPRLREKLDDPDPNVVSCTVNVLTELATENPKGYLGLAPALYQVLTASSFHRTPLGMQVLTTAPSRLPTGAHHLVLQLDAH